MDNCWNCLVIKLDGLISYANDVPDVFLLNIEYGLRSKLHIPQLKYIIFLCILVESEVLVLQFHPQQDIPL